MKNFLLYGLLGFIGYYVIIGIGAIAADNFHFSSPVLASLENVFRSKILGEYGGIASGFLTGCLKLAWKDSMRDGRKTERKIDRIMSGAPKRRRRSF